MAYIPKSITKICKKTAMIYMEPLYQPIKKFIKPLWQILKQQPTLLTIC